LCPSGIERSSKAQDKCGIMAASLNPLSLRTIRFGMGYLFRHPQKFIPRLQLKIRQIHNPDYPALAPGAVKYMDRALKEIAAPVAGEWGAGRSTLWLASRVSKMVSVEHDPEWYGVMSKELAKRGASHVSLALRDEASDAYADGMLSTGVKAFDLLLIDGRRRGECAAVARKSIKKNGIIVVDNSNRPEYSEFMSALGKPVGTFVGHCTQTTIFRFE
jgi:hypothetical protein